MNLFIALKIMMVCFLIVFLFCCKNITSNEANNLDQSYSKVKIYCWCLISNNQGTETPCTTPKAIDVAELIIMGNLFRQVHNSDTIRRLKSVVFNDKKSIKEQIRYPDSRFVLLFAKSDSRVDTLNVISDSSIHYNSKYYFSYPYNVMDSIRIILGKGDINCRAHGIR